MTKNSLIAAGVSVGVVGLVVGSFIIAAKRRQKILNERTAAADAAYAQNMERRNAAGGYNV